MNDAPSSRVDDEPTAPAADLLEAARVFFPEMAAVASVAGHADLVRVETAAGAWRVRRWPAESTEARLAFVHDALDRARLAGLAIAPEVRAPPGPDGRTVLASGGRLYDALRWLPGRPSERAVEAVTATGDRVDLPAVLPDAVVAEVVAAVARLHAATEELGRLRDAPRAPLDGLVAAVRQAWVAQRQQLRPVAPRTPPVQRWLAVGERALPVAEAAVEDALAAGGQRTAVLHLGLWPAHVLLEPTDDGRALTGLIGWESAAVGSPLLDLAQAVIRLRGWSAAAAELAIAAYGEVAPLAPEERRLLPAIAALDLVASAGRLLELAFARRPDDGPPPAALRSGASALVSSLETVTATVAGADRPRRPTGWRPRGSRPGGPAGPRRERATSGRGPGRGGRPPRSGGGPRRRER